MAFVRNEQQTLSQDVRPTQDCSANLNPARDVTYLVLVA